jgi:ParB family chromosome partitioning protein
VSGAPKRKALGRGLSALLPSSGQPPQPAPVEAVPEPATRDYFRAAIEQIHPSPEQPRKRFSETELDELAESIRAHGVIQPLIVRERPDRDGGGYYLIAGERRWRASQRAGLHDVPVVVQSVDSTEAFERALVENLQRSDLNPIEEAEAFERLVSEYGHTQEQVAERVGKDRSTVANALRLLKLPPSVRQLVEEKQLSMGHARALLGLDSVEAMEKTARQVVSRGMSVRATEQLVRARGPEPAARKQSRKPGKSAAVRDLEERLTKSLGARTNLVEDKKGAGGLIQLRYTDLDDLDRLLERLLS